MSLTLLSFPSSSLTSDDLVVGQLDRALASFEVEALRQLLLRLLDGVGDFLHVGLRDDVEREILRHR